MKKSAPARKGALNDIGTLWMMRRLDHVARCALMEELGDWEVRLIVDGKDLLSKHCPRGEEAFVQAAQWKRRMLDDGWRLIRPETQARVA